MKVFAALAFAASMAPMSAGAAPAHAVTIRAEGGGAVAGTMWEPSQKPSAAVVLIHMQTRTRDDWNQLGSKLADAGVAALAIDVRGLVSPADPETRVDAAPLLVEVHAALAFLAGRPDVRPNSLGIVGASMGANLAALAAAGDLRVRGLVLLSPGVDYRGLRADAALKKYAERPALLVASRKDPYALRSVEDLSKAAPGPREQRIVEAPAHGTELLSREPDLGAAIIDWVKRVLP